MECIEDGAMDEARHS